MLDKVFATLCEMLSDRGMLDTVEAFKSKWGSELVVAERTGAQVFKLDHDNKARVVFYMNSKLQKAQEFINKYIMTEVPFQLVIIVFREKMNSTHIKLIEDHSSAETSVQVFEVRDLMFNISKHQLVPKHEIVPVDEVQAILDKFNAKKTQLPNILHTDKMARYLNVRPGQLVKITRSSPTAGEYVIYRYCI